MTNEEIIAQRDKDDLKKLLSTKAGLRFIWRQLSVAGVFRDSFNVDPLVMAHNEGKRNTGLRLLAEIMDIDPDAYLKMTKMAKEDQDAIQQDQKQADAFT